MEITYEIAKKVLDTVNVGLVQGKGKPFPGQMCVEAAVCYAMGLPHGDSPPCVSPALRRLKIRLNDTEWSSDLARTNGLRELALFQLGSVGVLDEIEFAKRVALLVINKYLPLILRKFNLNQEANICEQAKDLDTARDAAYNARDAVSVVCNVGTVCAAARDAARAAVYAVIDARDDDAYGAAYAARAAGWAAAHVVDVLNLPSGDEILLSFAKDVAEILIDMKVPGVQWLSLLTEQKG
jgi:hypothetical protein